MLSWDEEDFLNKLPSDKVVRLYPYNPKIGKVAEKIINSVHSLLPDLEVKHMGASALKLSGQGDIDIYMFAKPNQFTSYLPDLIKIFGEPKSLSKDSISWKFLKDGFDVELYLTNPASSTMQKQIKVFDVLKNNKELQKEYEDLKMSMNGQKFKEYQRKKYEFYHELLGE